MNKIEEIFKAWGIMFNPNDSQTELAVKRMQICDGCEHKKDEPFLQCSACGCMLKAKVYSPKIGACPHSKWIVVELDWEKKKNINNYNKLKS